MHDKFEMNQGLGHQLEMALARYGWTKSLVNKATEGDFLSGVRDVLEGHAHIVPIELKVLPVSQAASNTFTVLPNLTLAERTNAGSYGWVSSDITEKRFPHDPTTIGEWEWELVGYDRNIPSEVAKAALEVDGWVVARWEHELAFGAAFPEAQRKNPIVALGSVCRMHGVRCVLALWRDYGKRVVYLSYCGDVWSPFCRFLRVRKVSTLVA